MKNMTHKSFYISLVFLTLLSFNLFAEEGDYESIEPRNLIILGSFTDYPSAVKAAVKISKKTKIPYTSRGLVWDDKRGLIFPDNFDDIVFAGDYSGRRSQFDCNNQGTDCISVEKSDFYQGFTKGLYIIVGGVLETTDPTNKPLFDKFKKSVKDTYIKETPIFMGCLH